MHTKDLGEIAVAFVLADLTRKGYKIALPMGENNPFDLIAIRPNGSMLRIQVKYRSLSHNGSISVKLASIWKNSSLTRVVNYDLNMVDYFAIYCPEVNRAAYISTAELRNRRVFALRVLPAKNNQSDGIRSFDAYSDL